MVQLCGIYRLGIRYSNRFELSHSVQNDGQKGNSRLWRSSGQDSLALKGAKTYRRPGDVEHIACFKEVAQDTSHKMYRLAVQYHFASRDNAIEEDLELSLSFVFESSRLRLIKQRGHPIHVELSEACHK